jgi:hypothetical protein
MTMNDKHKARVKNREAVRVGEKLSMKGNCKKTSLKVSYETEVIIESAYAKF